MPLSKLEYTRNIEISPTLLSSFFKELHATMVNVIDTDLASCKSSASILEHYCIADGKEEDGFIILYIQILPGRSDQKKEELKKVVAQQLMDLLKAVGCARGVQVRVLISEVDQLLYYMGDYS